MRGVVGLTQQVCFKGPFQTYLDSLSTGLAARAAAGLIPDVHCK